jgi:hypothetical protein
MSDKIQATGVSILVMLVALVGSALLFAFIMGMAGMDTTIEIGLTISALIFAGVLFFVYQVLSGLGLVKQLKSG